MKSLLLEDYYTIKSNLIVIIGILLIYGVIFIPTSGYYSFLLVATTMFSANIILRSLIFDETSNWKKQALVMPISRKDFVLNKFLLLLFSVLAGFIIGTIINFLYSFFSDFFNISVESNYPLINYYIFLIALCYPLFCGSVSICLSFIFGFDKARILLIGAYLIPAGIFYLVEKFFTISNLSLDFIMSVIPFATIIIYIVSLFISIYFFKKKEL